MPFRELVDSSGMAMILVAEDQLELLDFTKSDLDKAALHASRARLRILLIDDEPNILKSYERALGAGHDLVLANHGEEALDAIHAQSHFDLVVCDLSMPTMSGMQLFERVRELAPALTSRFVFATGGATQKSVEQFLAALPNQVLEKPFEMRVLRELVADRVRAA